MRDQKEWANRLSLFFVVGLVGSLTITGIFIKFDLHLFSLLVFPLYLFLMNKLVMNGEDDENTPKHSKKEDK